MTTATTIGLTVEQQEIRRSGVGASEVPAICGLSPWSTAIDVYLSKIGQADEIVPSDAMEAGNRFEDTIGAWYHDRTGRLLVKGQTTRHPDHAHHLCTPDFLWADDPQGLTQIKLVLGSADDWGEEEDGEDAVPEYVRAQELWEMHVTGRQVADVCAFGAFRGPKKLRTYRIHRDDEAIGFLREIVDRFWTDNVLARVQPAIDGSDKTREWLRKRYPNNNGVMLASTPEAIELARQYREAEEAAAPHLAAMDEAKNRLMDLIGEADGITGVATWKRDRRGRTEWKALAEHLGATEAQADEFRGDPPRKMLIKFKL